MTLKTLHPDRNIAFRCFRSIVYIVNGLPDLGIDPARLVNSIIGKVCAYGIGKNLLCRPLVTLSVVGHPQMITKHRHLGCLLDDA